MRKRLIALALVLSVAATAWAYDSHVPFTGTGLLPTGFGSSTLASELCGTQNGAPVDGPYLRWTLKAPGATAADLTLSPTLFHWLDDFGGNDLAGDVGTHAMTPITSSTIGKFKYRGAYHSPFLLQLAPPEATYRDGGKPKHAQLSITSGCRPFYQTPERAAWCEPEFWQHAADASWQLTGYGRSNLFNATAYPVWFGAPLAQDLQLQTVLDHAEIYGTTAIAGTSGWPFDAVTTIGAMLTDAIPGYRFDWYAMQSGSGGMCPIDQFGHFKN
jgi:hypothetical protein